MWRLYSNIQIFLIRRFIQIFVRIKILLRMYSNIHLCQKFWYEYIRIFVCNILLTRIHSDIRSCQNPYECHTLHQTHGLHLTIGAHRPTRPTEPIRVWWEFSFPRIPVRISFIFSRSTLRNNCLFLVLLSKHEIDKKYTRSRLEKWNFH